MRKEIFYAIFAGGILGLVIAFGVWRANIALKPNNISNTSATQSPVPSGIPTNSSSGITLASPQNDDVFSENPVRISGVTKAESFVTISAEVNDYIIKSEKDGSFQADVELSGGVNQVVISAIEEDGTSHIQNLTLIYSTEFK